MLPLVRYASIAKRMVVLSSGVVYALSASRMVVLSSDVVGVVI